MRAVRNDHDAALLALAVALVVGADNQDTREFAVRARRRLQGDGVHPGNLGEVVLKVIEELERALHRVRVGVGVQVGEQFGGLFVDLGVVFHGA